MFKVLLIWIYVFITTYILGYGTLEFLTGLSVMQRKSASSGKLQKYNIRFFESYIFAGLIFANIYAEIWSIFGGVGVHANLVMLLFCGVVVYHYHSDMFDGIGLCAHKVLASKFAWVYILLIFVMAYGTSHGIMHYDSDLYHAQAIEWIEKYGVVKGLGNLHLRLGYNSASFALTALYSFHSVNGQSYHVMTGFFALLLAWQCVDIKHLVRRKYPVLSDFVRLAAIYYLFTIYDEMVAPASDYFIGCLLFYIIIHWLDLLVLHEKNYAPFVFLTFAAVYTTTVKLSAAMLMLLAIKPIVQLVRTRKKDSVVPILFSVAMSLLISIPFFVRNVILSGWLIYPFTSIDLFNVPWKVPKGQAAYDAKEIMVYGRGYTDVLQYDMPFSQWFPDWFSQIGNLNKMFLILDVAAVIIFIASVLYLVISDKNVKAKKTFGVFHLSHRRVVSLADFLLVDGVLIASMIYWLLSSPLIRYGSVYLWIVAAVVYGRIFILLFTKVRQSLAPWFYGAVMAALLLVIVIKGSICVIEEAPRFNSVYFFEQQDYGEYEVAEYEVNGITFYYPVEGDRVGYAPFPSAPTKETFVMLGDSIRDGFGSIYVE